MSNVPCVLIHGTDTALLESRELTLVSAGYEVHTAHTLHDFIELLGISDVALSVLCHSLSPKQCSEAFLASARLRPDVKVLQLIMDTGSPSRDHRVEVLYPFIAPGTLIAAVSKLLTGKGRG